jgi:hypothetical protein
MPWIVGKAVETTTKTDTIKITKDEVKTEENHRIVIFLKDESTVNLKHDLRIDIHVGDFVAVYHTDESIAAIYNLTRNTSVMNTKRSWIEGSIGLAFFVAFMLFILIGASSRDFSTLWWVLISLIIPVFAIIHRIGLQREFSEAEREIGRIKKEWSEEVKKSVERNKEKYRVS